MLKKERIPESASCQSGSDTWKAHRTVVEFHISPLEGHCGVEKTHYAILLAWIGAGHLQAGTLSHFPH